MTPFKDIFVGTARRNRKSFITVGVFGVLLGGGSVGGSVSPEMVAALAIYFGSFVTLLLCRRVVGGTFRDVGASLAQFDTTPWRLYGRHLALAVALAWTARGLMMLALAPFQLHAPIRVIFDPVIMGWPLDLLLVGVMLSLNAALGSGGAMLAFVLVFVAGAAGTDAVLDPEFFGPASPLLQATRFPWLELRRIPEAAGSGDLGAGVVAVARLLAYLGTWVIVGVGALRYRASRAPTVEGSDTPDLSADSATP